MKYITILGSTGSIGTQALSVIRDNPDRFRVAGLTCGCNVALFRQQLAEFRPGFAACLRKEDKETLAWEFPGIRFYYGQEGIDRVAAEDCHILLNALMGMRGLVPTYKAIRAGHHIALANKETLVAGGSVIMKAVEEEGIRMLPVDSEHSAIFQCLEGNRGKEIRRLLLTASGGPFRGWSFQELEKVTPEMALKHPNWTMGQKITIDSATMMNKGLEMIEAMWLFRVDMDRIQVLVHPQSVMHSGVEFCDSSILAQLGVPDMRVPIEVALAYPDRLATGFDSLDFFSKAAQLTFEKPDPEAFRCLALAAEAGREGGSCPVVMNAANEVLVQAFLDKRIGFNGISRGVEKMLEAHRKVEDPDLDTIVAIDRETRERTEELIG